MTEPRVSQRQIEQMFIRVGVLYGDRGDPNDAALRKRDLGEMKDLLAGLKVFQKTIGAAVTALQTAVDQAEADILALDGRATALEGRATSVEGRAGALETRATNLETRATNLELTRLTDAPNDANTYGRKGAAWVAVPAPMADAASDGQFYARRNGAWAALPSQYLAIATYTASATAQLSDANGYVRMNVATANTFTVPPNSSVAFPVGTAITLRQAGAGQTTVVAGAGVTINTAETLKARKQGSTLALTKVATDTWDIVGDMELAP